MSDGKTQKLSRALVALSAEPAVERCPDKRARASRSEQRQRRSELYGIDIAEHRHRVTAEQILERRHAFDIARAKKRMRQIGACLGFIGNRIALRHCASPKPRELREDEPHPMRSLLVAPNFFERAGVKIGRASCRARVCPYV